ncbi:ATP-binding protein [Clavibacter michiganensis]|uniref:ATP-binding protein n=1 Tax=Clavibacter michiganensis TaxID=28447 RepID=UPI003EBB68D2
MTTVRVTAQADFIDRLISTPRAGLLELIWNSLDADATEVVVGLETGQMGGALGVSVTDNGHGLSADLAEAEFGSLGGSWKKRAVTTEGGRALHGQQGRGRFAAYGLGNELQWKTVADSTGGRKLTTIRGVRTSPDQFEIDTMVSSDSLGTEVMVTDLTSAASRYMESDKVLADLTAALAIYISKYHPRVVWRERALDPSSLIENQIEVPLEIEYEGETLSVPLTIIEWNSRIDRALYLCDENGVALEQLAPGIQAPGFIFTAYANWAGFAETPHDLILGESAPEPIPTVIGAVQDALRAHFKARTDEKYIRLVEKWKEEDSYPFDAPTGTEDEAATATRELFDVVAFAASPAVEKVDASARKFSLRLLKEAVQYAPDTLHLLLQEIVSLPEQQAEDLRELITKSSLPNLIKASKKITNRLEFLASLESIINENPLRASLKERSQLHKILVEELWVFREEYALVGNDQTLRTVLNANRHLLDEVQLDDDEIADVVAEGGRVRVVDLILSRTIEQQRDHKEHLVIELKRPDVHIGLKELRQIEDYATMIAGDSRFAETDTRWEFWIIGDKMTPEVRLRARQANHAPGITLQLDSLLNVTVRCVTWAQVIRDAKHRLKFVKDSLDYDPSTKQGLAYLRREHAKFLPAEAVADASAEAVADASAEAVADASAEAVADASADGADTVSSPVDRQDVEEVSAPDDRQDATAGTDAGTDADGDAA